MGKVQERYRRADKMNGAYRVRPATAERAVPIPVTDIGEMVFQARLRPPALPSDLVDRPRLLTELDRGLDCPVRLIAAPAGYGKTTLASHWIQARGYTSAWVTLEDQDNGVAPFVINIAAAMGNAVPGGMPRTLGFLKQGFLPNSGALALAVLNDLNEIERPCVLVLDGVERLREPEVLDLLSILLRHPPPLLRLVLVGKRDPFVPIAKLRATMRVTELRAKDLRFTPEETMALLEEYGHLEASPETARAWTEATEGWITGLQLALTESDVGPEEEIAAHALTGHVREYLRTEILDRQPEPVRRFLLDIAILDRLCSPLCNALVEPDGGRHDELLRGDPVRHLRDWGVFLVPLDNTGEWYRLHKLVREFLVAERDIEYDRERDRELHRRAGCWFADHGHLEDAVRHAMFAGDGRAALALVEEGAEALMDRDQWDVLRRTLRLVPMEMLQRSSRGQIVRAWIAVREGRHAEALRAAEHAESLEGRDEESVRDDEVRGAVRAIWSAVAEARGLTEYSTRWAREALKDLGTEPGFARGVATANLYSGLLVAGDTTEASALAAPFLETAGGSMPGARDRLLGLMCAVRWAAGDVEGLDAMTKECERLSEDGNLLRPMALAHLYRGLVDYEGNDLLGAEDHLRSALGMIGSLTVSEAMDVRYGLAHVYRAQGRHAMARRMAQAADQTVDSKQPLPDLWHQTALKAELALAYGKPREALELVEPWESSAPTWAGSRFSPRILMARALLAEGDPDRMSRVRAILCELDDRGVYKRGVRFALEIHALRALLLATDRRMGPAIDQARRSLSLAESVGFVRWYIDMGPTMAEPLRALARSEPGNSFVRGVLNAYSEDALASGREEDGSVASVSTRGPLDELTPKESATLELLAQGLYNREIAERSFVSVETVKTHLKHIYRKLEVANRRQAVTRAKALGLLTAD